MSYREGKGKMEEQGGKKAPLCFVWMTAKAFAQALNVHADVTLVEKPNFTSISFLPIYFQAGLSCVSVFTWPYKPVK